MSTGQIYRVRETIASSFPEAPKTAQIAAPAYQCSTLLYLALECEKSNLVRNTLDCFAADDDEAALERLRQLSIIQDTQRQLFGNQKHYQVDVKSEASPDSTAITRKKISNLIGQFAAENNMEPYAAWVALYNQLHSAYGFNVRLKSKCSHESLLDVCERHGQLDRLFALASALLVVPDED